MGNETQKFNFPIDDRRKIGTVLRLFENTTDQTNLGEKPTPVSSLTLLFASEKKREIEEIDTDNRP